MPDEEKNKMLEMFRDLRFNILFATTVVEVGIDIPNATIMIIESAERFGLAQLHQLRGRVGRGKKAGECFILAGETSDEATERLQYFTENQSGFELADYDLRRRGPGEVYGSIQTGIPDLKVASIFDIELLDEAKIIAKKIVYK
jgi:ATP-dependent DNA helicase RecG